MTLAAALLPEGRDGRTLRPGVQGNSGPPRGSNEQARDRPGGSEILLGWVLASAVGGAVGGFGFVLQFFGELVLFGGLLGLVQWFVLRTCIERAGWWVPASFFGWFAGSAAGALLATPADGQDPTIALTTVLAWAGLGAFQALAVYGFLGSIPERRGLTALWLALSGFGGVVAALVAYRVTTVLPGEAVADLLPNGLAPAIAGQTAGGALYGAATGVALAEVSRNGAGLDGRRHGAETHLVSSFVRRARSLRPGWSVAVGGSVTLLALAATGVLLVRAGTCSQSERAVYEEFSQYAGRRSSPERNYDLGSCSAFYSVDARPGELLAYFGSRLRQHGWKVETLFQPPPSAPPASSTSLVARRGDYRYSVTFYPAEGYGRPGSGGNVSIDVYKD